MLDLVMASLILIHVLLCLCSAVKKAKYDGPQGECSLTQHAHSWVCTWHFVLILGKYLWTSNVNMLKC